MRSRPPSANGIAHISVSTQPGATLFTVISPRRQLDRERLHEADHRPLGRRVVGVHRLAALARRARHEHDAPAVAHHAQRRARGEEHPVHVLAHRARPALVRPFASTAASSTGQMPALPMNRSSPPNSRCARERERRRALGGARCPRRARRRGRRSRGSARPTPPPPRGGCDSRCRRRRRTPRAARAVAAPMPREPPVTSARFPPRRITAPPPPARRSRARCRDAAPARGRCAASG